MKWPWQSARKTGTAPPHRENPPPRKTEPPARSSIWQKGGDTVDDIMIGRLLRQLFDSLSLPPSAAAALLQRLLTALEGGA